MTGAPLISPEHVATYDYLAGAYTEMGDTASAIETYRAVLEIDPENSNARSMLNKLEAASE